MDLARAGAAVFPCSARDKTPLISDWENNAARSVAAVFGLWRPGAAIGLACGPSGLFVIDLDTPKPDTKRPSNLDAAITSGIDVFARLCEAHEQPWPDTYTVRTGRGGLHLYFRNPDPKIYRNTSSDRGKGLGWLIDTRGGGGYVIAPPSVVDGLAYTITRDVPVADLPDWLRTLLTPPPPARKPGRPGPPPQLTDAYLAAAVRNAINTVLQAPPGQRNDTLNAVAYGLGRLVGTGRLSRLTVELALTQAAEHNGLTEEETRKTINSGLTAGAKDPREIPPPREHPTPRRAPRRAKGSRR